MIKLDLFDFCSNCPEFEPDVNKYSLESDLGIVETTTRIRCKHREKCKKLFEYINGIPLSDKEVPCCDTCPKNKKVNNANV